MRNAKCEMVIGRESVVSCKVRTVWAVGWVHLYGLRVEVEMLLVQFTQYLRVSILRSCTWVEATASARDVLLHHGADSGAGRNMDLRPFS